MFEYYVVMKNPPEPAFPPDAIPGVLKAMSPGVVDFLFRQLVAGEPAEDVQWRKEGTVLSAQAPVNPGHGVDRREFTGAAQAL